ncbi:MAG: hypothetical protein ABJF01_25375 [bacterium]
MAKLSGSNSTDRQHGGERVFADDEGRLWSAGHSGAAVVFTCISDGRHSGRALAMDAAALDESVSDDTLRAWLNSAPQIGTLP